MKPQAGEHDPLAWSSWRRRWIRLLAGHMPFGFAKHFEGPSEYVTLLRNPISRTLSDYFFCRSHPSNPAHGAACELSLIQFVEKGYGLSQNCYTRWLSNEIYGRKFSTADEMLKEAVANLSQFSFVGLTEESDSVQRLCARYGLTPYPTSEANRNSATPSTREISEEERHVISRHNALDLIIYEQWRKQCSERALVQAG